MKSQRTPIIFDEKHRNEIENAKILVVGAGGIGCEVLKNLAMSGFKSIEIIDMDTIEFSNLNRQFLFLRKHVGQPKAIVAKETILGLNPEMNVIAYHDSITNVEFGVNFFKNFNVVLNALDNRAARNHVNRMCLAADVPLIESGTAGYSGQVEFIKKNITQCYECQPKVAQKTYPGCTIRNTPSEPVHCIVWAKHLFNQLFGEEDPDQDVSPDSEDPEAKTDASGHSQTSTGNVQRISTRQWAVELNYEPQKLFNKFFKDDINYLLKMENLWKTRKPPVPLNLEIHDNHSSNNGNDENNIKENEMKIWSLEKCAKVFSQTVRILRERMNGKDFLLWDKDDEPSMDFVTACANLRCHIFSIEMLSSFSTKSIAGSIIPAIATANAIIAGLVVLLTFRVLQQELTKCPSVYLRTKSKYSKFILAADKQLQPPNPKCYVCVPQPMINVFLDTKTVTVKQFEKEILKDRLNMIAPDVMVEGKYVVLISSEEDETQGNETKTLSEMNVVDGTVLKCDDFLQNYDLKIVINQYVAKEKDEPLFKIVCDPDEIKAKPLEINEKTEDTKENNGDDDDDDEAVMIVETKSEDPQEGSSSKKRKLNEHNKNQDDDDDDIMILDEIID